MKSKACQAAALLCAALGLWGCIGGSSTPTRYYVLAPAQVTSPSGGAAAAADGPSVELARVILPEYLNHASILTRSRANEVQRAENDLWAGPLVDEITRTMGENLSLLVPTDRLSLGGTRRATQADFAVEVEIVSFERDAANMVHLVARWSVYQEDGRVLTTTQRSAFQRSADGADHSGTAAAMSRALADLCVEIAGAIRKSASVARGAPSEPRFGVRRSGS